MYEIELEQRIPGSGAVSAVSGSVLRPGLVIDDPFLIQSIVNSEAAAAPDLAEAANTVVEEEVVEEEEGTVFKENIFVESQNIVAETQDIFVNPSEEQFAAFSGSVEEVPILDYSDYYTVAGGYDYTENGFEDYSDNNNEVEEVEREPSLHCDLSILLSGISCSFNLLDEDTAPALAPAPRPVLTPPPLRTPAPTPPPAVVAPWSTVQQSLTVTEEQEEEVEEEEDSLVPFLGLDIEPDEDEDDGLEDVTEVADVTKERFSLITNTTAAEDTAAGEEDKELRHVVNHLEELHQD